MTRLKPTASKIENLADPSEHIEMDKASNTPHKISRITCVVNQQSGEKVTDYLRRIGVEAYVETGRNIREYIKPKAFGLPGNRVKLQSSMVSIFRCSVPREHAKKIMESIIAISELHIPGRGTIFSQDVMEFSKEAPFVNLEELARDNHPIHEVHFLKDLSYVICVLSGHEAGEQLAKTALELGVCVPLLTYGTGSDIRDQLGLIRITISPEKEIVHLVMPKQDSNSIIRLLAEESKLDRPGSGYIYQTPVTVGLVDTRIKVGKQNYAASIDQIIAAIDTLKMGTDWRKRLDAETQENISKSFLPNNHCEISVISDEDKIDELREVCIKVGAIGTVTSKISRIRSDNNGEETTALIRSEVNVPVEIAQKVVDSLLGVSSISTVDRIQVLNSPVTE